MGALNFPPFMADDLPRERPELDPATVAVGDQVVVLARAGYRRGAEPTQALVTKKGRVWIEVEATKNLGTFVRTWRFRMDTQNDDGGHYGARFRTPDQHRYDSALNDAEKYLKAQGVRLDRESPWYPRVIDLARVIWTANHSETIAPAKPLTAHHLDGSATVHPLPGWPDPDARPTY